MRIPLVLLLATSLLLTTGSRPYARAEEEEPPQEAPVTPHMVTLLQPLALTSRHWRERRVTVTRAAVFDRALVIGLRAPDEAALQWAIELVRQKEAVQVLLRNGELQMAAGVLREEGQIADIDLALTVPTQTLKQPDVVGSLKTTKVMDESEFMVNMRPEEAKPIGERELNGLMYAEQRRIYRKASAYQFLALAFNVMSRTQDGHAAIRAAHWQAAPKSAWIKGLPVGTSVFEIRDGPIRAVK